MMLTDARAHHMNVLADELTHAITEQTATSADRI